MLSSSQIFKIQGGRRGPEAFAKTVFQTCVMPGLLLGLPLVTRKMDGLRRLNLVIHCLDGRWLDYCHAVQSSLSCYKWRQPSSKLASHVLGKWQTRVLVLEPHNGTISRQEISVLHMMIQLQYNKDILSQASLPFEARAAKESHHEWEDDVWPESPEPKDGSPSKPNRKINGLTR